MNMNERNIIENIVKYCLLNFQVQGSSRIISSFICQILREQDIDILAAEGVLYVDVNGLRRPFAHCFNVKSCDIIDGSVYGFALMNKAVSSSFPTYVIGTPPDHIDYYITKEFKPDSQFKFKKEFLHSVISELPNYKGIDIERFDELFDYKKQNLFYLL